MLSDFAWKTFESTGSVDSYLFFRELKCGDVSDDEDSTVDQVATVAGKDV